MKAIVKATQEAGSLEVKEVPTPKPGPRDVLVKIKATGFCYTDISILNNKYKGRKPVPIPVILGHELGAHRDHVPRDLCGIHCRSR
ncbi:MAG: L-threonine 3-dehydrogenase [Deltaproteobacteria bacterium]|nr:L-threonine 3-dehydrogenase [Deltaproteobacteria bacterium]